MAFLKKTWKNRQSEHPNRRKLIPVSGAANTYDVERAEGLVMEEGGAFNAETMNDLEKRIASGFTECGMNRCTHQRAGTVHRLTGEGENLRFVASADLLAGDTFTLNGKAVTAKTATGELIWPGYFKTGSVVVCYKNGNVLTFSGGGLSSADKKTAEDFLPQTKSLLGGSVRGKVPVLGEKRWTPASYDQQIPQNRYTGGTQTVAGDSSLKPENIRKGVSLFLVSGTYDGDHQGPAASVFNTLLRGWGTAKIGSVNNALFNVSGNTLIAKREMQLRLVIHLWSYYDWDQSTTVVAEFDVSGARKANCNMYLTAQTHNEKTASDTVHVSSGTQIKLITSATADYKTYGGAVGYVEVV